MSKAVQVLRAGLLALAALLFTHATPWPPLDMTAEAAPAKPRSAKVQKSKVQEYVQARRKFAEEAEAYWQSVVDKRRVRIAKRRNGEPILLEDYVLTQPPVYRGPPRPPGVPRDPGITPPPRKYIPVVAEMLAAAREHYQFTPDRPESDLEFKRAYARVAAAAGLTKEQAVRVYGFETGGNGTYDVQAGLTHPKKGSKAISPAVGYNQLLATNSIGIMAAEGEKFVELLLKKAEALNGDARTKMDAKIGAIRRMIAACKSMPYAWIEHDKFANTPKGWAIHALVLDIDVGPLLQTQKLLDSVLFARTKGHEAPLTAAELEMMNLTGDGNGIDIVTMPAEFRGQVPTSNFFQRGGYSRNPVASRHNTVEALLAAVADKMERTAKLAGAQELADAFPEPAGQAAPSANLR